MTAERLAEIATMTDPVAALRPYIFDDNADEHPCRCGDVHRGSWAINDWMHHNCNHDTVWHFDPGTIHELSLCAWCGATIKIEVMTSVG